MIPWLFVFILLAGMVVHLALGVYSRRFRTRPVQFPFEILMYICAVWAASFALDISTDSLGLKVLFMQIRFLGLPFVTLLLLIIAIRFTGHGSWLTRQRLALLSVIPAATTILALLTDYTPLLRYGYHIVTTPAGFTVLGFTNGTWSTLVYNPYTYLSEIVTVLLLLWMAFSAEKIFARQALLFFVAIIIPIITEILFTLGITPEKGYDITTSTFAITGILLAIAIFRYRFIDVMPVARSTLFERMADPMLVVDPEGRLADFNAAAEMVLGLSRVRDLGKDAGESLRDYKHLVSIIERTGSVAGIAAGSGPAAQYFDLSVDALAPGPDAPPLKLVHLRDITDRKKAEDKLHETAEYLGKLVDFASAPIIVWNPDFAITRFNHAFERLTGRTEQEVIGQQLEILFPEESRTASLALIKKTLAGERWESVKIPILDVTGRVHTLLWNSANILTEGADLVSIIAQGVDITENERMVVTLRESERRYYNLYHYAQVGLFETSLKEAKVIACNQQYANLAGFNSVEEAIGQDVLGLYVNPEDRTEVGRILRERGSIENHIVQLRNHATGKVFWAQFSARYDYEQGIAEGTIVDISAQKEAEVIIQNSNKFLDNIIEQSPNPIWISDGKGTMVRLNRACSELLHVRPDEVIGRYNILEDSIVEMQGMMPLVRSVFEEGKSVNFDLEYDSALLTSLDLEHSVRVFLNVTIFPIQDAAGRITSAVIQHIDFTERRKTEEALRRANERLRKFVDANIIGVIIANPSGEIIETNDYYLNLIGYTRKEFEDGMINWRTITPPEWIAADEHAIEELRKNGICSPYSKEYVRRDGTRVPVILSDALLPGPEEQIAAFALDITGIRQTELKLRESEEKYREFFTTSRDCVFITSPEGQWIDFNDAAMEMFRYDSREEFARTNIKDLYYNPVERAVFIERIDRQGYVKEYPIQLKTRDSHVIDTLITAVPLRNPDGTPRAFIGTIRDITEQKKTEERIQWLASFPALNPNPVIEMDAQGTITFANEATRRTLEKMELPYNPAAFIPEDKDEILQLLLKGTDPFIEREVTLKDQIYAETISLNRALHVVRIYTHNITQQKNAEKHRERLLEDLEQKNTELERFTYTVSHDLKSPLITIRGFAGLIEADIEKEDMIQLNKDIDRITTAADTMQELLTDLLELSRIGRITKPFERIGFGTIVHESAELLAGPLAERGARLEIAPDLPEVYVDHARIRQVMNNLIENAIKFSGTRPDPVIRIGVDYKTESPVFFVQDNGIGLDSKYLERIFNLFEKLDVSVPGTGIGLTTVRRIIEVHGGKIWAESEGFGKGTTFRFTLPGVPRKGDENP